MDALREGLCDEVQQATCAAQFEHFLDRQCARCDQRRVEDLSPYTMKMLRLRSLKKAGYPLGKNDLTMEEWEDMGSLEDVLDSKKAPIPVYLVKVLKNK